MIKPHRLVRDRVTDIAVEAAAYLRRRRFDKKPFARVFYAKGRSSAHTAETEAGRALFVAASHLVEVAGPPLTRRQQKRGK